MVTYGVNDKGLLDIREVALLIQEVGLGGDAEQIAYSGEKVSHEEGENKRHIDEF